MTGKQSEQWGEWEEVGQGWNGEPAVQGYMGHEKHRAFTVRELGVLEGCGQRRDKMWLRLYQGKLTAIS